MILKLAEWLIWLQFRLYIRNRQWEILDEEDDPLRTSVFKFDAWKRARKTLHHEVQALVDHIYETTVFQWDEARIIDARLKRRYDPAPAFNEAVERAKKLGTDKQKRRIEIRPGEFVEIGGGLTGGQEAALKLNMEMQRRRG